jgi:hypothetical protein
MQRAVAPWQLDGVEPSTRSGGSLLARSTPTWSTEDGGSHHGLHGRRWGWAWAGDEEANTRKDDDIGGEGGGACGAPLASVPLLGAPVAAPQHDHGIARWCGGKS